jgi:hypothetical protein
MSKKKDMYTRELFTHVFSLHHSPSCPKRFEVRLIGHKAFRLDNLRCDPASKDICGYGNTLEVAAKQALQKKFGKPIKKEAKRGKKRRA